MLPATATPMLNAHAPTAGSEARVRAALPARARPGFRAKFARQVAELNLLESPRAEPDLLESEIARLPEPVRRYLTFMGVSPGPRDWSFCAELRGHFRMQKTWLDFEAMQYDTRLEIARIFHMRVRMAGVVPVYGRDTYHRGRGRMLGRAFDLFPVIDASGREFDIGELVTYLNDAVLFAPGLLLGPETEFDAVDDHSFDVTLTNSGTAVTARVFVDASGAVASFSTTDRFYDDPEQPKHLIRTRWTTPISDWQWVGARPVPRSGRAIWHLPSGPLEYIDFEVLPASVRFNIAPSRLDRT